MGICTVRRRSRERPGSSGLYEFVSLSVDVRIHCPGADRGQLDRVRQNAQSVALSATDKSVSIVETVSRGNVRLSRVQVRDLSREGGFEGRGIVMQRV